MRRIFRSHRTTAGTPRARPHRLRYTYGTELVAAGLGLLELRELMGHAARRPPPATWSGQPSGPRRLQRHHHRVHPQREAQLVDEVACARTPKLVDSEVIRHAESSPACNATSTDFDTPRPPARQVDTTARPVDWPRIRNFDNYRLRLLLHCGIEWNTIRTHPIRGRLSRLVL